MYTVLRKEAKLYKNSLIASITPLFNFVWIYKKDGRYYFMLSGAKVNSRNKTHQAIKIVAGVVIC